MTAIAHRLHGVNLADLRKETAELRATLAIHARSYLLARAAGANLAPYQAEIDRTAARIALNEADEVTLAKRQSEADQCAA